jgi:hypothetical protein
MVWEWRKKMNVVATKLTIRGSQNKRSRRLAWGILFALTLIFVMTAIHSAFQPRKNSERNSNTALTRNLGSGNQGKTNIGLVNFAWNALDCQSGYVFGAVGQTVTPAFLQTQAQRFAGNTRANLTGSEVNTIYNRFGGHPAFDCIGLIKAYSWIDEKTGKISSKRLDAMPDCSANGILENTPVFGSILSMPDIPGLAVQMSGHIGVYVGNGEVIEAQGNQAGVKKTKLSGRGWKWYVMVPTLTYVERGTYLLHGQQITVSGGKIVRSKAIPDIFDRKPI